MWIHLIEESQELLSFIFSEKQKKKKIKRLTTAIVVSSLKVNRAFILHETLT